MVALWVLHAATIDAHQHSPRLAITSPIPNCGKTTLCFAIGQLLGVPVRSNVSIAAFFRTVAKQGAAPIILDEADTFLSAENKQGIGILNSGHARAGALVSRVEHTANGGLKPSDFGTWAPVVFGLIGTLPAASLKSRCLGALLRRKRPDEEIEALRDKDAKLAGLRTRLRCWSAAALAGLREAEPELPVGLFNRDQDNWRPLLAVADAVGGKWPSRAREIALALNGLAEDPSEAVMLLADIRKVFAACGLERIDTKSLLTALNRDGERPWQNFRDQVLGMTDRQVAALLALFDIRSETVRIGDKTPKGYKLEQFADAFERYLPPLPEPDVAAGVAEDVAFAEG
jgi:putative DNA primase/helicase